MMLFESEWRLHLRCVDTALQKDAYEHCDDEILGKLIAGRETALATGNFSEYFPPKNDFFPRFEKKHLYLYPKLNKGEPQRQSGEPN